MKRLLIVLCTLISLFAVAVFVGCGNNGQPSDGTSTTQPPDTGNGSGNVTPPDDGKTELQKFTGITFADKSVTYNGNEQSVMVSGAVPTGTKVTYISNTGTNAGVYNASVTLENDNYETLTLNAKLTINKAQFAGITFVNKTFVATGSEKSITVSGELPENTQVIYTNNKATVAGVYNATAVITNPNYETLTLTAKMTIKNLMNVAAQTIGYFFNKPDAWSFMPAGLSQESMVSESYSSNFTEFVNVSQINAKPIGKQLHVLYEGLNSLSSVLKVMDNAYSVAATIASVYQTFINDNPDDYAQFTGSAAGFKLRITLDGDSGEMLIGNSILSAELKYDRTRGMTAGRIQLTDGMAVRYETGENHIKFSVRATIAGVGNLKQIEFSRLNGAVTGYLYEYTGTAAKNLKTSAVIASNAVKTVIMSDKRESDDLHINGYEEVYSSVTGEFIGGEVSETVKSIEYDTLWFMLGDVSGLTSVKVTDEQNGLNADTVYINGSATAIKTALVGGISLKATSRRYDIEMKDVWYVVLKSDGGEREYETVKASIPMLFVQKEHTDTFTKDFNEKNSVNAVLPSASQITSDYTQLQELFLTIKEEMTYEEIDGYIGIKNSFFA